MVDFNDDNKISKKELDSKIYKIMKRGIDFVK